MHLRVRAGSIDIGSQTRLVLPSSGNYCLPILPRLALDCSSAATETVNVLPMRRAPAAG